MAVFTKTFVQDLKSCLEAHITEGLMFSADNESNIINVELYDGGVPATVTGDVVAYAIREDENTVVFSGTLSGNVASATLPQSCFAAPGPLAVLIQIVSGDVKTTVLKAVFTVVASTSGAIIDPGHEIPDIADIIAMLDELEEAVASLETTVAAAEANALKAEGYAVGTQDGTAVTSGSPYYEDNAKYYADKAETLAHASTIVKTVSNANPIAIDDGSDDVPVKQLLVNIIPTQAGEGDPSPTNIRAISGHVSVEVTINGTAYGQFFPAAAGTVYAGTLDVLTGVLTVNHAIQTLTSAKTVTVSGSNFHIALGSMPTKAKGYDGYCTHYNTVYPTTSASMAASGYGITFFNASLTSVAGRCFIHDDAHTTVGEIKAYWDAQNLAGTPVQVVYPIASPQTYQLTPLAVKTLLGNNSLSVDCGTLTLTYVVDMKTYIDDNIDEKADESEVATKANASTVGIVCPGTTAPQAITAGQFVIWQGQLYKATTNIASGETLSTSSNLEAVPNGGMNALLEKIQRMNRWELINTVTVTEDSTEIKCITDSNGNAFRLRKMIAIFSAGPSTTGTRDAFYTCAYGVLSDMDPLHYVSAPAVEYVSATSNMVMQYILETNYPMRCTGMMVAAASTGSTQTARSMINRDSIYAISGFRVYQYSATQSLIPANATITIYGIRYYDD